MQGINQILLKYDLSHLPIYKLKVDPACKGCEPIRISQSPFFCLFMQVKSASSMELSFTVHQEHFEVTDSQFWTFLPQQKALWCPSPCFVGEMISTSVKLLLMVTGHIELCRCLRMEIFGQWRLGYGRAEVGRSGENSSIFLPQFLKLEL